MSNIQSGDNLKVAIITHTSFPEGLAASNRVFYHATGLKANNVDVKVYIATPTEQKNNIKNTLSKGSYKGIDFEYSLGKSIRSSSFMQRRIDDFIGPIMTGLKVIKDNPDAAVAISHSSIYVLFILKLIFLLSRITFIVERTEVPLHGNKNYGIYKYRNKFFKMFLYKNLDGFLVISYELIKRYSALISKKCPIELIPVIIDIEDIYDPNVVRTKNIVYTGPLLQKKDGILTIIESFSKIADEFPETNLICTGSLDFSRDKEKVKTAIENSGVKDRIIMRGFISRDEMVELLNSAACLVLAKPTSDQSDTCFPTKLGEYLATGNPIAVTLTGEIPIYLEDKVNAYIAEPDSIDSFADKLRDILKNPEKSKEIGLKGKEVAENSFNYAKTAKKVVKMINDLNKRKNKNP